MDKLKALQDLHVALGLRRLSTVWAKAEILVGLTIVGIGLSTLVLPIMQGASRPGLLIASNLLMVLGAYLAMAGHRSHIYQSNNLLAAYLAHEINQLKEMSRNNTA